MPDPHPTVGLPLLRAGLEPIAGYELIGRLGGGAFGEVWKATAPGGFPVALKFVRLGSADSDRPAASATELRALRIIRDIHHPNLLAVFGTWETEDYLIVASELADGTLRDRFLKAVKAGHPGIPRDELLDLFEEAAKAIDYLNTYRHSVDGKEVIGVQHRDIKPDNILLVGGGVKVADYGMARLLEKSMASHSGGLTIAYAAPEFFNRKTSEHSDQYSLGVTYCEMRGGRLPFVGSLEEVIKGHLVGEPDLSMLPAEEVPVLARAMAKEPGQRWPSCRAMIQALRGSPPKDSAGFTPVATTPYRGETLPPARTTPPTPPPEPAPPSPASAPAAEWMQTLAPAHTLPPGPKPEPPEKPGAIPPAAPRRRYGRAAVLTVLTLLALPALAGALWVAEVLPVPPPAEVFAKWFPRSEPADLAILPPKTATSERDTNRETNPETTRETKTWAPTSAPASMQSKARPPETIFDPPRKTLRLRTPDQITLRAGSKVQFEVQLQRDHVAGPVEVRFAASDDLILSPVTIAADKQAAQVQVEAKSTAAIGPRKVHAFAKAGTVQAEADVLLVLQKMASLSLEPVGEWVIPAGEVKKFRFRVVRDGHADAVEVRLADLPAHIYAQPVQVPAGSSVGDSEATIEVTAADNAREGMKQVSLAPSWGSATATKLTVQPSLAAQAVRLGDTLRKEKHLEAALREYGEAIRRNPKTVDAYRGRGLAYGEMGQYDKAIAEFSEAISLDPAHAPTFAHRGVAYDAKNDHDKAIADYNEALRLYPKDPLTLKNRGLAYRKKREYDKAIADFDQAIKLDSKYALAYASRGHTYHLKGDYPRAIADYTEAIKLDPKYAVAFSNRAYTYHLQGEYDKAITDTTEAVRLNPSYDVAFSIRGFTYLKKKNFKLALDDLNQAINLDPTVPMYYDWRARVFESLGDKKKAEDDRKTAASLNKKDK